MEYVDKWFYEERLGTDIYVACKKDNLYLFLNYAIGELGWIDEEDVILDDEIDYETPPEEYCKKIFRMIMGE